MQLVIMAMVGKEGENIMERMKTVKLTDGECQEIRYALENRIEYLVYALHMHPMCDDIQTSIRVLDFMGYHEQAKFYRSQLKEWQDMYDNNNYPDYDA